MLIFSNSNQTLTADLHALGYHSQLSVDFSPLAIDTMRDRSQCLEGLEWRVMDVRNMVDIAGGTFEVAIDKVNISRSPCPKTPNSFSVIQMTRDHSLYPEQG